MLATNGYAVVPEADIRACLLHLQHALLMKRIGASKAKIDMVAL